MGTKVIEVSAGLVFRSGKLLITQRLADAHLGGLWGFPGGNREAGELFEQCLSRELREELGVEVAVGIKWLLLTFDTALCGIALRYVNFLRRPNVVHSFVGGALCSFPLFGFVGSLMVLDRE